MFLTERKLKILYAIINDYIATAEPVGSRTIAKNYSLGISSATVRNEMSDLEEMGFIIQPHTSAGRIPSDKGYRLYVDNIKKSKALKSEDTAILQEVIKKNIEDIDYLMQETAKAISYITNYTTLVSEPNVRKSKLKHIQLLPFNKNGIIAILVTDSQVVKNFNIKMNDAPDFKTLSNMSLILNHFFSGETIDKIDLDVIKSELIKLGSDGELILSILDQIVDAILSETDIDIYKSGVKNILGFPEFSDLNKAREVFQALEEKDVLITLLGSTQSEEMKILIGKENTVKQMHDCSIIRTGYRLDDNTNVTIGILGPTRMDYSQAISVLLAIEKYIKITLKILQKE